VRAVELSEEIFCISTRATVASSYAFCCYCRILATARFQSSPCRRSPCYASLRIDPLLHLYFNLFSPRRYPFAPRFCAPLFPQNNFSALPISLSRSVAITTRTKEREGKHKWHLKWQSRRIFIGWFRLAVSPVNARILLDRRPFPSTTRVADIFTLRDTQILLHGGRSRVSSAIRLD